MPTVLILLFQYEGVLAIPLNRVVKDYFGHLTTTLFIRQVAHGDIELPIVRVEPNNKKSVRGVHIVELARYIDSRRAAAIKEMEQLDEE